MQKGTQRGDDYPHACQVFILQILRVVEDKTGESTGDGSAWSKQCYPKQCSAHTLGQLLVGYVSCDQDEEHNICANGPEKTERNRQIQLSANIDQNLPQYGTDVI